VAKGIIWAADNGAQIINLSLGGASSSITLENAVNYALAQGVILVAATGNAWTTPIYYPARYAGVIAVGATDSLNQRANFSNYGNEIDLVAPGTWIYSLAPGNKYVYMSGTSMAAPQVAGLAAILAGIPGNSLALIENQIKSTALGLGTDGWDIYYGNGLIQMDGAIRLAQPATATPTQTASPTLTKTYLVTSTPTSTPTSTLTKTLPATPTSTLIPTLTKTLSSTPVNTPISTLTVTASLVPTRTPVSISSPTSLWTYPPKMPDTGFVPGKARNLPVQPKEDEYQVFNELWLEIPVLHLNIPLVGIPQGKQGWDVSWLGQRAGWLNGTAFPTWPGNSVITGHVWDASNQPGVFFQLKDLHFGEDVKIHAWGMVYTYQVQENRLITSGDFNYVYEHETFSMLSLLTCEGYNPAQKQYDFRRVVRAVLVKVDP
jgi:LPXTG-site transpeptidase (sortase) family protein